MTTFASAPPIRRWASGVALAALLLGGCANLGPYRTSYTSNPNVPQSVIETTADYQLGYVEFDEQGWLWTTQRQQISAVEKMIIDAGNLADSNSASLHPRLLVVAFVHGWKHNARDQDRNVVNFREILQHLADDQAQLDVRYRHKVIGVYLGWPGLRAEVEPFQEMSFYSRKNTGDKVGYYDGVTEVLLRLEKLQQLANAQTTAQPGRTYFVAIGHSFGAEVVFNSTAQIVTERLIERRLPTDLATVHTTARSAATFDINKITDLGASVPVAPFGDAVILINPAFESSRYYNLKTLTETLGYPAGQRPVVAIFGSETDHATGLWFPVGRYFSTLWEHYRDDELGPLQQQSNLRTVPGTDQMITHRLTLDPRSPRSRSGPGPDSNRVRLELMDDARRLAESWNVPARRAPQPIGDCLLTSTIPEDQPWTPFYVVKVDSSVIDGHGDIWNDRFKNFLTAFITFSTWKKPSLTEMADNP